MNRKQRRAAATAGTGGSSSAAGDDARHGEALFRQALQLHQSGRLADAEVLYRNVLALAPRHAGALNYLGVLHHQTGRSEAAAALIRQAIAADRDNAEPRYSLGLIHASLGQDADAITQTRRALKLDPDHVEARTNLGVLLLRQGQPREATEHLARALDLAPSPRAYENLAQALVEDGRADEAIDVVLRGLRDGGSGNLKSIFVMIAQAFDPAAAARHHGFRAALARALTEPWCRPRDLARLCCRILALQGESAPDQNADDDPLLAALLTTTPVVDLDLERQLTAARRALLDGAHADAAAPDDLLGFAIALARQCFINEYVFAISDDEARKVRALNDSITAKLAAGGAVAPMAIALSAAYGPLHALADSERLARRPDMAPIAALITQQIREPRTEREIRATIPALTPITDATSTAVRAQYEQNPYPRWSAPVADRPPLALDHYIRARFPAAPSRAIGERPIDLLVAGCGTGMHAIERVIQFRPRHTLAIDLSLSSLSYAARKSREAGLTAIEFAQADILALDALDRRFDLIDASGVLHHMRDPFEGWRALARLLRPGGLMSVALYSATARTAIRAAREVIAAKAYAPTPSGIRALRHDIAGRAPSDPLRAIVDFPDFYSMSDCRDLLMHVQEHQFSLPEIAAFLDAERFTLLGFETRAEARYRQRFPDDPAATDLANWARFEADNPATFAEMYQFWIQKRPGGD